MRTFAQPGGGAKKVLETRSHLDRGRTMSFEKLCRVLATGHGDPCASPAPASTRRPLEPLACFKFRFLRRPQYGHQARELLSDQMLRCDVSFGT